MLVRARRARRAWDAELVALEAESRWPAHELVPTTLAASDATARRATWTAYRPRIDTLISSGRDASTAAAACAASVSAMRSHIDPCRVRPAQRFPPEALLPGQIPAHDARCPAVGNALMSGPT